MTRALAPWVLLAAGCGGGPHLTHLRCRAADCQSAENPLRVLLAVDFTDGSGTLDRGRLDLRVGGHTQGAIVLADLFQAQGIAPGTKSGTLQFDLDLVLDSIAQNVRVETSVVAWNGQGDSSNEPNLTFNVRVGGP